MHGVIGLDVGGSGIRAGFFQDGALTNTCRAPLPSRSVDAVVGLATELIGDLPRAQALGVAVPGFAHHGRIERSPNFPEWRDVPFATLLQDELKIPVHLENDASAAAWGAYVQRGRSEDLVLMTLGTGVGGGIVSGGQLIRGHVGCGAELGHVYVGGTEVCGCGAVGCLEAWVSTSGFKRRAAAKGVTLNEGRELWQACRDNEAWAQELTQDAGTALGRAMAIFVNMLNPEVVLIAGGLTEGKAYLEPSALSAFEQHAISTARDSVSIVWSGGAEQYSLLGVADLAGK